MRNIKKTFILALTVLALCSICNAEVVSRNYEISSGYVLKRNWSWGYTEEYYYLSGQFRFIYNIPSSAAFDWVDVELDEEITYFEPMEQTTTSLNELFHMTELQLIDANETKINFVYEKNIPTFPLADVNVTVTFMGDNLLLTGRFSDAIYDGWQYDLYAIATQIRYSGGTGEPNDPYLIATPNDLNSIGLDPNDWDKHFVFVSDINLIGYYYTKALIAWDIDSNNSSFDGTVFSGIIDGNNHKIYNFSIDTLGKGNDFLGLIGCINGGQINNMCLRDVNIVAGDYSKWIGGLVGESKTGNIENCNSIGSIRSGDFSSCVGGLVGANGGDISKCYSVGTVEAFDNIVEIGGFVGYNYGSVTNCYNVGSVHGGASSIELGGMVGLQNGTILNCYTASNLTWGQQYSTYIGGFAGLNVGSVTTCFWDTEVSDCNASDGGTGLPTSQMHMRDTFADADWDMINIWDIGENQTYPFLRKHLPSDINKDGKTDFYDLAVLAEHWLEEY